MRSLLTGNEAIALGFYLNGGGFASGYPGTPSTKIIENLTKYQNEVYTEWAPNEKVAVESVIGASYSGIRSLASMKHVGVNVAADSLATVAYTGINAGMIIVTADDSGIHSSQNEQDNRNYSRLLKIPMFEPSNSQECLDFIQIAFELSEKLKLPIFIRLTTRICHSKTIVKYSTARTSFQLQIEKGIGKCKFICIDLSEISSKNNISKKFQNMILLGFFVKYLHLEEFNWHELITSSKNYEAFILGTNS